MDFRTLLNSTFLGNSARIWLLALTAMASTFVALLLVRKVLIWRLSKRAEQTDEKMHRFLVRAGRHTHGLFLLLLSAALASSLLELSDSARDIISKLVVAAVLLQLGVLANDLILFFSALSRSKERDAKGTMVMLSFTGRLLLWIILAMLLLDNFGVQLTTLVATLGIGGIAVALAAQSVLGDLLAAVSIYLDKPFVIGDFIAFDGLSGNVEYVGLRSTRLRSLAGERVVLSNSDLLRSRIHNHAKMSRRRVVVGFSVAHGTPRAKLQQIPAMVREAVESQERTRFDRAHLSALGHTSVDFEGVYFVLASDFNLHMDIKQAVYLRILERFEEAGITLAHPRVALAKLDGGEAGEKKRLAQAAEEARPKTGS